MLTNAVAVWRDQLRPDSRVRDKDLQQHLTDLDAEEFVKRQLSAEVLQAIRAVETLERIGSPAALDVLKKLASGEPQAHLTRHAAASVKRLEKR